MGQGIQTIKAATEGIEKAEDLIIQMKAIAEQVNNGSYVPEKEYFIQEVGENGAVVSTAEELRQAIADKKETICVYGKINLGDISTTDGLQLQENQKLVGVNYFGNFVDGEGFSSISATSSAANSLISITKIGCLVSDLSLNYENTVATGSAFAIKTEGNDIIADLQNLDIIAKFSDTNTNTNTRSAIASIRDSLTNITGKINIYIKGYCGRAIFSHNSSINNICSNANINITTLGNSGYGIYSLDRATTNIQYGANVNIQTFGQDSCGIVTYNYSTNNLNGNLYLATTEIYSYGIFNHRASGNTTNIASTAQIYLNTSATEFENAYNNGLSNNILEIASGARIAFEKNGSTKWYEVKENYRDENTSTTTSNNITADNVETTLNVEETNSWKKATDVITQKETEEPNYILLPTAEIVAYQKQYNSALSQYDALIKDSIYKGINLLQEDSLRVNFNEDKTSHLMVQGVDVTSDTIGLQFADWQTGKDVADSLSQVLSAKNKLRSAATQLGNYYSIITERQTFTENLINVLTEGADKLSLADMNEESANMLSLQTRQSLAINSLSLASQANQAVLRLF